MKINQPELSPAPSAPRDLAASGKTLPPSESSQASSPADIEQAAAEVNRWLESHQKAVRLVMDPRVDGPVVHIIQKDTGQLVRQIPTEQVIRAAEWWQENGLPGDASPLGLAINERA